MSSLFCAAHTAIWLDAMHLRSSRLRATAGPSALPDAPAHAPHPCTRPRMKELVCMKVDLGSLKAQLAQVTEAHTWYLTATTSV